MVCQFLVHYANLSINLMHIQNPNALPIILKYINVYWFVCCESVIPKELCKGCSINKYLDTLLSLTLMIYHYYIFCTKIDLNFQINLILFEESKMSIS